MQKIVAITLALATFGLAVPVASAETITEPYQGALGARVLGQGVAVVVCPAGCNFDEDAVNPGDELNPIGGVRLLASQDYTNVVVSASDEGFWGSNAGIATCFWNPAGDNVCNADDYASAVGCGGASLTNSPFAADFVTVWIHTLVVTEALDICGGTFGTIAGDFF